MRAAEAKKSWDRVNKISNYSTILDKIEISKARGFQDEFVLTTESGITAICGKNGVGKTTLLKTIYENFSREELSQSFQHTRLPKIVHNVEKHKNAKNKNRLELDQIYYLEPSIECMRVVKYLKETTNTDELLEGLEENNKLNTDHNRKTIENIIGKKYKSIKIYEIDNVIESEHTFPYFKITLPNGTEYNNLGMGLGEFQCLYIAWYLNWMEKNSILLIEEMENFISAYSQKYLINYMAFMSANSSVCILLTTHSEHILNIVGIENIRIIYQNPGKKSAIVKPKHKAKYLKNLGVNTSPQGAMLVEDKFAQEFLCCLLRKLYPQLLADFEIIDLKGESNIEKVVRHYTPRGYSNFELIAVFDADMSKKILSNNNSQIYSLALPSTREINPEECLWPTLESSTENIAKRIGVDSGDLEEAVEQHHTDDHHDRFQSIASTLSITPSILINATCIEWLENPENKILAYGFVFAVINRKRTIKVKDINKNFSKLSSEIKFSDIPATYSIKEDSKECQFLFNGLSLLGID